MQLIKNNSLILYIFFTKNNILCTLTNLQGKVIITKSTGSFKSKGLKKVTNTTLFFMVKTLFKFSDFSKNLYVKVKGTNKNKTELLKLLKVSGFNILLLQEKLLFPYGGCRKSKTRKV